MSAIALSEYPLADNKAGKTGILKVAPRLSSIGLLLQVKI